MDGEPGLEAGRAVDPLRDAGPLVSSAADVADMSKLTPSTTALSAPKANLMHSLEHASLVAAKPVTASDPRTRFRLPDAPGARPLERPMNR